MEFCSPVSDFTLRKNSRLLPGDDKGEHFSSANNIKIFKLEAIFFLTTCLLTNKLVLTK